MSKHLRTRLLALIALSLAFLAGPIRADVTDALPTVQQIDLDRYAGRWYEISRLPMWFERNCVSNITATYTLRSDKRIDVLNRCHTQNGAISARGIAEVPDPSRPGELRVRFAPDWLAWFPLVWGDYWILELDTDYRWVMIGAPSRNYLWILARTPTLDQETVDRLKRQATALGFDIEPMIDVDNKGE